MSKDCLNNCMSRLTEEQLKCLAPVKDFERIEQKVEVPLVEKTFLHESTIKVIMNTSANRQMWLSLRVRVIFSVKIAFVRLTMKAA